MSRRAAVLFMVAVGAIVAVGVVSRGAAVGADTEAWPQASVRAPRDQQAGATGGVTPASNYWIREYRRRWRLELRNGRARARSVRALRRTLTVHARRRDVIAGVWVALARCESGGRWEYNGSSGFDGGLQFHPTTWSQYAPPSYPSFAWQASPGQQVDVARRVFLEQGWQAWPRCSRLLGLR